MSELAEQNFDTLVDAIEHLKNMDQTGRNLQMPGDGRYQPKALKPFLGYDNWACWLTIVEWFWLLTLAEIGHIPAKKAKALTKRRLLKLLTVINTTDQDAEERGRDGKPGTNHDINALLILIRRELPPDLHQYVHFAATSYDIINTAYALQAKFTFSEVFAPKLKRVDELWRKQIKDNAGVLMMGRTHLQHALPITAGFWLANLHNRFVACAEQASFASIEIPGKFSGAVGTSASQRSLLDNDEAQRILLDFLDLPSAGVSTQITPPEGITRFYHELVLLSGSMANLGDDVRKLVAPEYGEVIIGKLVSSTSSAMSHKESNPIVAEQVVGIFKIVISEYMRLLLTLTSDFQRDLCGSSVMRGYSTIMVYVYQQLEGVERLLKNMSVDAKACRNNFDIDGKLVTAELLHLSLQVAGLKDAHHFVNSTIVPMAKMDGLHLDVVMDDFCKRIGPNFPREVGRAWRKVPDKVKYDIANPDHYLGDAISIAQREAENKLDI